MTDTNELLGLIDLLEDLLDRSDLAELEVQAGELGILLRKPGQLVAAGGAVEAVPPGGAGPSDAEPHAGEPAGRESDRREGRGSPGREGPDRPRSDGSGANRSGPDRQDAGVRPAGGSAADDVRGHAVIAPLTGVFYGAPSPGAAPYVTVGSEVVVGQVIGLIEAMKLFNEIKSDAAGRVVRIHAADGALVRAKQPLIEIEPS
jgi:biotin carboxyl carrier protein